MLVQEKLKSCDLAGTLIRLRPVAGLLYRVADVEAPIVEPKLALAEQMKVELAPLSPPVSSFLMKRF